MARKRRMKKVAFNQKLVVDVVLASLLVQKAPELLNRFLFSSNPLTGMTATAAGVGAGYLAGSIFGKSDLANASIALGAVEFIAPLIDDISSGVIGTMPAIAPTKPVNLVQTKNVADYLTLNDYVSDPTIKQSYDVYRESY